MKKSFKNFGIIAVLAMLFVGCTPTKSIPNDTLTKTTNLEGQKVTKLTTKIWGMTESEALSEDGSRIIKRPYVYWTGRGKANDKQAAIELAQREAYAAISRTVMNAVADEAERGNVGNNGAVQQALKEHWTQFSTTVLKSCSPFGDTEIEYNPSTGMYDVTARVAIIGSKYESMLETAGKFSPETLTGDDLQQFIQTNKSIMEASKPTID